ncbi:MAG TPA: LuxR C-terminal-related transcriptional regulator [Ramlibacter sp.]|nr:LuxR C-terminal-related transcriptional regulator [Ramlibacter sp.]
MKVLANSDGIGGVSLVDGDTSLGSALMLLMDELAHGVVVTTVEGRLLHANLAGRRELGRARVLELRHQVLRALAPADSKSLQAALAKVAEGKRSLIGLSPAQGAVVTVAVLPLKGEERGRLPNAALLFARESVCEALMLCFFARSHALTATEEHVLGILCQGFSAPEIAAQMDVAVSTIRSHVRSLCVKTRSSGVRQLVNRVAVLPPVAPPFWSQAMH